MSPNLSPTPSRSHTGFMARTATDEAGELDRRFSVLPAEEAGQSTPHHSESHPSNPYEPLDDNSTPDPRRHELTDRLLGTREGSSDTLLDKHLRRRPTSGRRKSSSNSHPRAYTTGEQSFSSQMHNGSNKSSAVSKPGLGPRPIGGNEKLGMFSGVFVPTSLNVLSILMFLRFGFILGQGGVVGIMGMCFQNSQNHDIGRRGSDIGRFE